MKGTFEKWMAAVDAAVGAKCGMSYQDLPDVPYRDWWEDGVPANTAAARAVRMAQGGEE